MFLIWILLHNYYNNATIFGLKTCIISLGFINYFFQGTTDVLFIQIKMFFNDYYKIFEFVFEDCDNEFKREIILNSEFLFYQNENKDDKEEQETNNDLNSNDHPVIEQADEKSRHVYFLISG